MATQKQFELVRNLLALARSPFPAEAAAAKKKADELILKYGITEADLVPPKPPQRRKCPGCPNCQPMRAQVIRVDLGRVFVDYQEFEFKKGDWIRVNVSTGPSTTTTSSNTIW